jgi:hypothetical protein
MSDTVMIEVPTTARMLACCAGIAADGHEPKPAKPGTTAAEYLGMEEAAPVTRAPRKLTLRLPDEILGMKFDDSDLLQDVPQRDDVELDRALADVSGQPFLHKAGDVCRPDLVEPDSAEMVFPERQSAFLFGDGARFLCPLSGLDSRKVSVGIVGKGRRASELGQRVVTTLRSHPVQFRNGLGDRLHRVALAVYQGHTAHALLAGAEILNAELRVKSRSALPESAHRLLASIENFWERRGVRMNLCADVCAALACVTFHGVKAAQMVAQRQADIFKCSRNTYKHWIAGVAKWQTHRT